MMSNTSSIILIALAVLAAIGTLAKIWLKSYVERSAQAVVERDLEVFKSDLRQQEVSLNSLQTTLLSGRATRTALYDRRHLEAVDTIWQEVVRLRAANIAVSMMQMLKVAEVNERAARDQKMRDFLSMARGPLELKDFAKAEVDWQQPFVGPVLWTRFATLRTIYLYAVAIIDSMSKGIEQVHKIMADPKKINDMIGEVLPYQKDYIKKYPGSAAFFLIEQLSSSVLSAIQDELNGVQADAEAVKHARHIIKLASELETDRQKSAMA